MSLILILILAVFQCSITNCLIMSPDYYQLGPHTQEGDDFRSMKLGNIMTGQKTIDYDTLTTLTIEHDYGLTRVEDISRSNRLLLTARPADYRRMKHACGTILGDLKRFPIPKALNEQTPDVVFENDWMQGRSYGTDGESRNQKYHKGCDIMGSKMPRGYYPVVGMSDGVVERTGWLEMGGWRIGIRCPGRAYLYYAHLCDYARGFQEGDQVKVGELLDYMGDTGCGETEGTTGNFDVRLHLGIYIKTDHNEEMSMNPFWILKYLKKRGLIFTYQNVLEDSFPSSARPISRVIQTKSSQRSPLHRLHLARIPHKL